MNSFLSYVEPLDIAKRLYRRKRLWYHGNPTFKLVGELGKFGHISFDFIDEIITYKIYIKDKQKILNACMVAIGNFNSLVEQ